MYALDVQGMETRLKIDEEEQQTVLVSLTLSFFDVKVYSFIENALLYSKKKTRATKNSEKSIRGTVSLKEGRECAWPEWIEHGRLHESIKHVKFSTTTCLHTPEARAKRCTFMESTKIKPREYHSKYSWHSPNLIILPTLMSMSG